MTDLPPAPSPTALDRVIGAFSPERGLKRYAARWRFAALAGGYKGASRTRRSLAGWRREEMSPDTAILGDLDMLRGASNDLIRNNPLAAGAINTKVTSIIGTGLRVAPEIDAEALGLSAEEKRQKEGELAALFAEWASSHECDAARRLNFSKMQDLAYRARLEGGDVFALKRFIERPGSDFGFKLQLLEGARVADPPGADAPHLAGGVELDANGAPVAIHISPGINDLGASAGEWKTVPMFASDTGRQLVIHLMHQKRPGQTRGVPDLAGVIDAFKQLGDYTDGELAAAVLASFFTVFIHTEDGSGLAPMEPTSETGGAASDKDYKLGTGSILDLGENEKIDIANPGRPNDSFDPFVLAILRQIGVYLELPYEILIKHFTASYSAARAALLEAWKYYRRERAWFAADFCQPSYESVIEEAVARGRVALPGFFASPAIRQAWLGSQWHGDAMPSIDPKKENEADEIAEAHAWKTAAQITAEKSGGNWSRNVERRGAEEQKRAAEGLRPAPAKNQPVPAADADEPDPEKAEDETENVG